MTSEQIEKFGRGVKAGDLGLSMIDGEDRELDKSERKIANAAYAQALADVDAAAEKLDSFNAWAFYDEDEKLEAWDVNGVTAPSLTQAILSTEGA